MTEQAKIDLEKEVLHAASVAKRDYEAVRVKLATVGERLEYLGKALQVHPEQVTPLPEIHAEYDYREALNELGSARQSVIDLCNEARSLAKQKAIAEQHMAKMRL